MERPEHEEVRLPVLERLSRLGGSRGQIVCPSPDSGDVEWRVPHPASEHSKREAGREPLTFEDLATPTDEELRGCVREDSQPHRGGGFRIDEARAALKRDGEPADPENRERQGGGGAYSKARSLDQGVE